MTRHHKLTRRRLLVAGGAAVATAAVPGSASAAGGRGRLAPSWQDRDSLTARVGDTFVMRDVDGTAMATRLESVRDVHGTTARGRLLKGRDDAYVLTFAPASGAPEGQAIRTFSHPELGDTQLFAIATETTYTVLINRSHRLGAGNRWSSAAARMGKPRKPRRRRRRT